jgi:large subunit ribosomal protein L25
MTISVDEPLKLRERSVIRKGLNRLRADGLVPAVIHNHGQPSIHVMGPELELERIYNVAGKHHPLQLHVGSNQYLALIKDAHFNPVKRRLQHIVFQAIKRDEKVEAEIPIRIDGEIPAEKQGLMLLHQLDHVEVEALPKNLPDELVVDGSKLAELHDKVTVADLAVPEGVTILDEADHPIATVVETRAQISDETEAEAAEGEEGEGEGEGAEGEEGETPEAADGEAAQQPAE